MREELSWAGEARQGPGRVHAMGPAAPQVQGKVCALLPAGPPLLHSCLGTPAATAGRAAGPPPLPSRSPWLPSGLAPAGNRRSGVRSTPAAKAVECCCQNFTACARSEDCDGGKQRVKRDGGRASLCFLSRWGCRTEDAGPGQPQRGGGRRSGRAQEPRGLRERGAHHEQAGRLQADTHVEADVGVAQLRHDARLLRQGCKERGQGAAGQQGGGKAGWGACSGGRLEGPSQIGLTARPVPPPSHALAAHQQATSHRRRPSGPSPQHRTNNHSQVPAPHIHPHPPSPAGA